MCVSLVLLNGGSRECWEILFGSVGAFERVREEENYSFIARFAK